MVEITDFIGKTFAEITGATKGSESILFSGPECSYRMLHWQNCCEHVFLEDVVGDVADLIGTPIVEAYEASSDGTETMPEDYDESFTWTFYRLRTIKGTVTLRWFGSSNGYYSESVDIEVVE